MKKQEKKVELIELYGASVILCAMIRSIDEIITKEKNAPGADYLKEKLEKTYGDIQADIYKDFTGKINNLFEVAKQISEEDSADD